ncbi:ATP-binding cassette domain-containing protein [Candidatus Bathyarchaeota archaeon]|nr:ATP-binding cassette domain-containing protein [Candidatus Bathyarchaeota archaeon]
MENVIEAINLTKYYNELLAVDHINFEVKKSEIFGFLGPNGAGKTTTIRMLTSLTKPSEGTARIFGYDIQSETIIAKRYMGIVPEISNIYDDLSAWDNLMFTGELYQVSKSEREKRAKELLEMFGLYDRRKAKAKGFSKGMKRRLTIAMGLINNPQLLFLDEPTSGLDVQSALIIKDVVRELNQKGVTIFLTTHNIEEANVTCDRVAIINKGKIAAIDTPERLKKTIQSVQSVEVAFEKASPRTLRELENIPLVNEARKEGDKFRLYTPDPAGVLSGLWEYAKTNNLKPISLNTLGPSLEDVFVRLTEINVKANREES